MAEKEYVAIRREWNDSRVAKVEFSKINELHWDRLSGSSHVRMPQPFVHGYIRCADVIGDIAHSCSQESYPHTIKICIVKKDNEQEIWQKIMNIVGPRPRP
jgi:hypothetical protein